MIRGLYTACSGMLVQTARQDVVANNIANAGTPGFKKDLMVCQAFPNMLIKRMGEFQETGKGEEKPLPPQTTGLLGTGTVAAEITTDLSTGSLLKTDNPLDLALSEGYLVVQTPQGERYTRNGTLSINSEGMLTTAQGYLVLGQSGPIQVERGFGVDAKGNVMVADEVVDTLRVVEFPEAKALFKEGENLFNSGNQMARDLDNPQVLQGYLESSNVNVVKEMVELISVMRAYEANQKVIQAHDQTLDAAINQVGPLR